MAKAWERELRYDSFNLEQDGKMVAYHEDEGKALCAAARMATADHPVKVRYDNGRVVVVSVERQGAGRG